MSERSNQKRIVGAIKNTILFFAITHLFILGFLTIATGNISFLNIFYILGITEFISTADEGLMSTILSIVAITAVFYSFYLRNRS